MVSSRQDFVVSFLVLLRRRLGPLVTALRCIDVISLKLPAYMKIWSALQHMDYHAWKFKKKRSLHFGRVIQEERRRLLETST